MSKRRATKASQHPVWQGLLLTLGAAALTLVTPAGAANTSGATAQTQAIPAALQLPFYQALAADTDARFENGCSTLAEQGLQGCFEAAGAQFSAADTQPLTLQLTGYGRGTTLNTISPVKPSIANQRVSYEHGAVTEWWQVLPMGFEQGFTVPQPLEGDGDLVLALTGSQAATLENGTISFGKLRYGKLVVSDANGAVIPSVFTTQDKRVLISVNDANATYPLTVDPLVWVEQKVAANSGAEFDNFGNSVAIEGNTAVIGAARAGVGTNNNPGAAYVFIRENGVWSQQAKLTADDGVDRDNFGKSVALAGNTAVIGADRPNFITGMTSGPGAAYVYTRVGNTWSQQAKLTASDGRDDDAFGRAVAVDGDTIMIGAPIASNGSSSAGPGVQQGFAYVFTRAGNTWTQRQKITGNDSGRVDHFGGSIALAGNTALIGASTNGGGTGAAYVFTQSGSTWNQQAKLMAADGANGNLFGSSVALAHDTALIGARGATINGNNRQGAAYIFTRSNTSVWTQQAKLTANDGAASDTFGGSVAIDGDTALVGADRLAAYLFTRSGSTWSQSQRIRTSDGTRVGSSVALADGTRLLGADSARIDENFSQGAAYFYSASDLDLVVGAAPTVSSGGNYISQAIITNSSNDTSLPVTVAIPVPASTTFLEATATQGNCSETSGIATCELGPIPGNAGRVTSNLLLKATASAGTSIVITANVANATPKLEDSASTKVQTRGNGGNSGSGSNTSFPSSGGGCALTSNAGSPDPTLPLLALLAMLILSRRRLAARLRHRG